MSEFKCSSCRGEIIPTPENALINLFIEQAWLGHVRIVCPHCAATLFYFTDEVTIAALEADDIPALVTAEAPDYLQRAIRRAYRILTAEEEQEVADFALEIEERYGQRGEDEGVAEAPPD